MTTIDLHPHEAAAMSEGRLGILIRPVEPQPFRVTDLHFPQCWGPERPSDKFAGLKECDEILPPFGPRGTELHMWRREFIPTRFRSTVQDIQCKRLHEVTEGEFNLTGLTFVCPFGMCNGMGFLSQQHTVTEPKDCRCADMDAKDVFRHYFDSLHGQGSWDANPWVWIAVLGKEVVK